MSNFIHTASDSALELTVRGTNFVRDMVETVAERAHREERGQTASEYLGILLFVGLIIFALVQADVGGKIKDFIVDIVDNISKGEDPKAG